MPFEIIRNDITHMRVDAIVNTANPRPMIGSGVDAAIHAKAGPMLLAARKLIGVMNTGEARMTPGFKLPCKHVIHEERTIPTAKEETVLNMETVVSQEETIYICGNRGIGI